MVDILGKEVIVCMVVVVFKVMMNFFMFEVICEGWIGKGDVFVVV